MSTLEHNIKRIFDISVNNNQPGFAVGIYKEGEISTFFSGKATLEYGIDISNDTKFHIASLTKHFTSVVFQQLELDRIIDRNEKLSKHLQLDIAGKNDITLGHLLDHESGLRDQWDLLRLAGWKPHDSISNDDILALVKRQKALNFRPGSAYAYNNTGYTLLSLAMEVASGKTMQQLLQEKILGPLGLLSTGYYKHADVVVNMASAYERDKNSNYLVSVPKFDVTGSTSMYSTIDDLMLLEKNFHQGYPHEGKNPKKPVISYQNGLINAVFDDQECFLHSGWDYGFSSFLFRLPSSQLSVVLLCNNGTPKLFNHAVKIAHLVEKNIAQISLFKPLVTAAPPVIALRPLRPGRYFNDESSTFISVSLEKGNVNVNAEEIFPIDENEAVISNSLTTINVTENDSTIKTRQLGHEMLYRFQNDLANPVPDTRLCGLYYSNELNAYLQIAEKEDQLIAITAKFEEWPLLALNSKCYSMNGFVLKPVESEGSITGLKVSSSRSWNMEFYKTNRTQGPASER